MANQNGRNNRSSPTPPKRVIQKPYKVFIPENIDPAFLCSRSPAHLKLHSDEMAYVISLITSLPVAHKDNPAYEEFTPICKQYLQRRGVRNYKNIVSYLIECGILEERRRYIPGEQSRALRFTDSYFTPQKEYIIKKYTLLKALHKRTDLIPKASNNPNSIVEGRRGLPISVVEQMTNNVLHLRRWFDDKLKADVDGVNGSLQELFSKDIEQGKNAPRNFQKRELPILYLNSGDHRFHVDSTSGRLHTHLVSVSKVLRKHISYGGQILVSCDVKNSQPYLTTILFNPEKIVELDLVSKIRWYHPHSHLYIGTHPLSSSIMLADYVNSVRHKEDIHKYKEMVLSGDIYTYFGNRIFSSGLLLQEHVGMTHRVIGKQELFRSFFSPTNALIYNPIISLFKEEFPTVFNIFQKVKQGKGKKVHAAFANTLQQVEAEAILHTACKNVYVTNSSIPLFTIHDSIVTMEPYTDLVCEEIRKAMNRITGYDPTVVMEYWR